MTSDDRLAKLFADARAGDEAALDELLEHARPLLVATLRSWLPTYLRDEVAEDLAQDTILLTAQKITAGEGEWRGRSEFKAWLRTLAEGQHGDWWKRVTALKRDFRRTAQEPAAEESTSPMERAVHDSETPSRLAARQEREEALLAAMETVLSEDERTAVRLRHFEHLSVNETTAAANPRVASEWMWLRGGPEQVLRVRERLAKGAFDLG